MGGTELDKAMARRLRCGVGGSGSGGWRKLLLVVAFLTSVAALFASFSSDARVSVWFSALPAAFSSYGDVAADSSAPPPLAPPILDPHASSLSPHLGPASAPGPMESTVRTAPPASFAPSTSPVGQSAAFEVYEGEHGTQMPPLGPVESVPITSPTYDAEVNSTKVDGTVTTFLPKSVSTLKYNTTNSAITIKSPPATTTFPSPKGFWRETDLQLIHAKREIAGAPIVLNHTDLYAPLFRNVSVFKRSYELMERILKVYVYEDGPKPLCHTPELDGIYASEGWFMKLMEKDKRFVIKDPNKAHLFYLPYSSRQLRIHLYVPDSHSMQPLSIFLRDYVNSISAKYPFWNRTRGADHFFVACHDWATYTTKLHDELRKNTIKAVCNADVSEGVFIRGKDVSLPETYIRTPKSPRQGVGGKPASKRSILAFFAGQMHGRVRPLLVQRWKGKDEDMRIYEVLPKDIESKMSYIDHMKSSKFCICPMGFEVNSPRIVEAIYYECVPVIIADNFVLPFEEVLDWSAFSIVVAEKDIPNLKDIIVGISPRQYTTMQMNVKRLQKHFLWNDEPRKYDMFHMILHSLWFNRLNQIQVQ